MEKKLKSDSLHSLIVAKTLLNCSAPLCNSQNRYDATAGLILLQDAIEAFLYSTIIEVDLNGESKIDKKNFDELIGELNTRGVPIKNQNRLKLLNKQRVLAKHYAQIVEPTSASQFYQTSLQSIEDLVLKVFSMQLNELSIAEVINDGEAKEFLREAHKFIQNDKFLEALIDVRKAVFVELEQEYNIADWKDYEYRPGDSAFASLGYRGFKCPSYKKNRSWISKHVHSPTDYLQVNYDELRFTALEYGFNFEEYLNICRFTPIVYRNYSQDPWSFAIDPSVFASSDNRSIAYYCLDAASTMIAKKQRYYASVQRLEKPSFTQLDEDCRGKAILESPNRQASSVGIIDNPSEFMLIKTITGLDGEWYDQVARLQLGPKFDSGYILLDSRTKIPESTG